MPCSLYYSTSNLPLDLTCAIISLKRPLTHAQGPHPPWVTSLSYRQNSSQGPLLLSWFFVVTVPGDGTLSVLAPIASFGRGIEPVCLAWCERVVSA